ncbi:EF-hand domain-containing protein [Streptomyces sp. 4F14]|uniref:EF-hand domain-containing protein n=1 Tax=Streptomyces sp. 4F14 TaxID=3394380 RepID=UPI003A8C65D1
MDTDHDGRVSLEEFRDALASGLADSPENYRRSVGPAADLYFTLADRDGDDLLSETEFSRLYHGAFGLPRTVTRQAFAHLDTDGSGFLTREQYQQRVIEYLCLDDPDAPGNWLFGPLDQPFSRTPSWTAEPPE